jgi:hypothetical protein
MNISHSGAGDPGQRWILPKILQLQKQGLRQQRYLDYVARYMFLRKFQNHLQGNAILPKTKWKFETDSDWIPPPKWTPYRQSKGIGSQSFERRELEDVMSNGVRRIASSNLG